MISLLACLLAAAPFSCDVSLSQERLAPQDHLEVEVSVIHPAGYLLDVDSLKSALPLRDETSLDSPFTLLEERIGFPEVTGDVVSQKIQYTLEPWTPGTHTLAFMPLRFYSSQGECHETCGQLATVEIVPPASPSSETAHAPLMPYVDRPRLALGGEVHQQLLSHPETRRAVTSTLRQRRNLWRVALFVALVALLVFLGWKLAGRLRTASGPLSSGPRDPVAQALSALEALLREQLPEKGQHDLYYVRLTSIVRAFVENRYEVRAPELTTEEFLRAATALPHLQQLRDFLSASDLVKFAALTPSPPECEHAHATARSFVISGNRSRV